MNNNNNNAPADIITIQSSSIRSSPSDSYIDSTASVRKIKRAKWSNQLQFTLSCIGVGLGNIWRFPMVAYKNGGGAFLIPYITCSFLIGFPLVYLEMSLGQFTQSGPALALGFIRPCLQGIGCGMVMVTALIASYYGVVIAWILHYLYRMIAGTERAWSHCVSDILTFLPNEWNTDQCVSKLDDQHCNKLYGNAIQNATLTAGLISKETLDKIRDDIVKSQVHLKLHDSVGAELFYWRNSCYIGDPKTLVNTTSASEEYFYRYVLQRTTMEESSIFNLNWTMVLLLSIVWLITAAIILKGVKILGYASYFVTTLPYFIIAILFGYALTLEGHYDGLEFYLLKPKMEFVLKSETWINAAIQLCFSLSIGLGSLLSMASFNNKQHNCFRDAIITTGADIFMSIFAGSTVFMFVGFMAHTQNKSIDAVVEDGAALIFIAYPEATSHMTPPWLWAFLFFFMLFVLGIRSLFSISDCVCTAIYDYFPHTRPYRPWITVGTCTFLFSVGLIMCSKAGFYYFQIFNLFSSSINVMFDLTWEVMAVVFIYGLRHYKEDLRSMFGASKKKTIGRWFGPTGYFIRFVWSFVTPLTTYVIFLLLLQSQVTMVLKVGDYVLPRWANFIGWFISLLPILMFPIAVPLNLLKYRKIKRNWRELFRLQRKWPSNFEQDVATHSDTDTEEDRLAEFTAISIEDDDVDELESQLLTARGPEDEDKIEAVARTARDEDDDEAEEKTARDGNEEEAASEEMTARDDDDDRTESEEMTARDGNDEAERKTARDGNDEVEKKTARDGNDEAEKKTARDGNDEAEKRTAREGWEW